MNEQMNELWKLKSATEVMSNDPKHFDKLFANNVEDVLAINVTFPRKVSSLREVLKHSMKERLFVSSF